MRFISYKDQAGVRWYEVISRSYGRLHELRLAYMKSDYQTWINPFDDERWLLTVRCAVGWPRSNHDHAVLDISERYLSFGLSEASVN